MVVMTPVSDDEQAFTTPTSWGVLALGCLKTLSSLRQPTLKLWRYTPRKSRSATIANVSLPAFYGTPMLAADWMFSDTVSTSGTERPDASRRRRRCARDRSTPVRTAAMG
jgi:hypothetical protein